jgi:YHS domain-containing protein
MWFRFLLWGLLLLLVFRALGRFIRAIGEGADSREPQRRTPGRSGTPAKGELMVRDPVCGTFVVQARALTARDRNGAVQHFCSDKCRQAFEAK